MRKIIITITMMILLSVIVSAEYYDVTFTPNQMTAENVLTEIQKQENASTYFIMFMSEGTITEFINISKKMENMTNDATGDINLTADVIDAETIYTNSKTTKLSKKYSTAFSNRERLSSKQSHYAYVNTSGKERLDLETRIVYLEGAMNELQDRIRTLESAIGISNDYYCEDKDLTLECPGGLSGGLGTRCYNNFKVGWTTCKSGWI